MSDVDELNSDADEYDPDQDGDTSFRVRDALEPPHSHPISTLALHALIHQGLVDLNPAYQRGEQGAQKVSLAHEDVTDVVWPESKQIGLIDSIFRNFYIPPIIFAVQKDEEGDEIRTCVDGKQRLTSISKFMDGQVYRDPVTKKKYWYTRSDNQSKSRLELPEAYKKQFQRKQITCVEYVGLVPGTERDIFQRVQLGMSLTAAEKLQAISSPLAQWVSQLQVKWVSTDGGMADSLKWDTSRGRDFQGIAQLCFCCWHLPDFTMPSITKVERWLLTNDKPSSNFKKQISSVLQDFLHLATQKQYQQAFTQIDKRVAPVEFVFIGILLAKMRECTWEDKAAQVLAMRQYTRDAHKDVRSNERVMKWMWGFVENVKTPSADPFENWEGPGADSTTVSRRRSDRKRKRNEVDNGDESFRLNPKKSGTRSPKTRPKLEKEVIPSAVRFVA